MINDQIRFAAETLVQMGVVELGNTKAYTQLLGHPRRDEMLRAAFLASKQSSGVGSLVTVYLRMLREELDARKGRVDTEVASLMAVLEDEDILTPADRSQNPISASDISFCLKYDPLMSLVDRVWQPVYGAKQSRFLWMKAFESCNTIVANRLADRASPAMVDLVDVVPVLQSVEAAEVFVSRLTPEAIAEYLPKVHGQIDPMSVWRSGSLDAALVVLASHHVRHAGIADGWAAKIFDEAIARRSFDGPLHHVIPQLGQLAKALGRLDDVRFLDRVSTSGMREMDTFQLAELLLAGMPASLEVPGVDGREGRVIHLLSSASADDVAVIAPHMSEEQRQHFVAVDLPHRLRNLCERVSEDRACAVLRDLLTELNKSGFDLGRTFEGQRVKSCHLHEMADTTYASAPTTRFIFMTLHVLGVYPQDLRYRGMSPLHYAAFYDDDQAIRALVAAGYDIDDLSDPGCAQFSSDKSHDMLNSPLVIAGKHGKRKAFETLLELGADAGLKAGTGASLMQLLRDEEMKRQLRGARTSMNIRRAMPGPDELDSGVERASDISPL